jgi:hypothetical protein
MGGGVAFGCLVCVSKELSLLFRVLVFLVPRIDMVAFLPG